MEAIITDVPTRIGGNVLNNGLIENLPREACVEVPCLVDNRGIHPTHVGRLPIQLAAMNMTNVNPQLLTIEAAATGKMEHVYQAAMLDPHTGAILTPDECVALCDELRAAHEAAGFPIF
jgi:alpha-galactosidase